MREILFRGKRTDNGAWIEGDFSRILCGDNSVIEGINNVGDLLCIVIPGTVGQYTGLTDKNDKRIFEGDIVRYGDTVHEVVFEQRNGTAYFGLVYSPLETLHFGHYQDLRQIEVIGNIHDNPELLKGE